MDSVDLAKARGSLWFPGQPELHRDNLSFKKGGGRKGPRGVRGWRKEEVGGGGGRRRGGDRS